MKNLKNYLAIAAIFCGVCTQTSIFAQNSRTASLTGSGNKISVPASSNFSSKIQAPKANSSKSSVNVNSDGDVVVSGTSYDYVILPASSESKENPSAKINMYDRTGKTVGSISFYRNADLLKKASSAVEIKDGNSKVYNVSYSFEMFEYFLTILENGKNLNIEYDTKTKKACVKTASSRIGATGGSNLPSKSRRNSNTPTLKKSDVLKR